MIPFPLNNWYILVIFDVSILSRYGFLGFYLTRSRTTSLNAFKFSGHTPTTLETVYVSIFDLGVLLAIIAGLKLTIYSSINFLIFLFMRSL